MLYRFAQAIRVCWPKLEVAWVPIPIVIASCLCDDIKQILLYAGATACSAGNAELFWKVFAAVSITKEGHLQATSIVAAALLLGLPRRHHNVAS